MFVVYAAILGSIGDAIHPPFGGTARYVAILDRPERMEAARRCGWEVAAPQRTTGNRRRDARWHKVLSHRVFPEAEITLWLDGFLSLRCDPVELASRYLAETDVCVFRHAERTCLYRELGACIRLGKDDISTMCRQVERYRREGYPYNRGLAETTAVLRRHTASVVRLNESWWEEISRGSLRDQLSFDYVCWKLGVRYATFPQTRYENPCFRLDLESHAAPP